MASKLQTRRRYILDLLAQSPICSTLHLAKATNVSSETIRKDLDVLANEGLILKVHGGVALANMGEDEIPFDLRKTRHAKEKKQIAKKGIQLISSGDSILLEGCTTNLELAKALCAYPELLESLTIITNSLAITSVFDGGRLCHKLFLLGGWINVEQYASHGHHTASAIELFHVKKAFLSGAALSENYMISGYYDDDVLFQTAALKIARQTILMLDHSKFEQTAILSVAHISKVDYLITDKQLSDQEKKEITDFGVQILQTWDC